MSNQKAVVSPLPDRAAVLDAVSAALHDVVTEDQVLLELRAHELAIVHRFAVYLESRLQHELTQGQLTIDLDYDRHGDREKRLPARPDRDEKDPRRFRPDLIVHRRKDDAHNLLVVEWKKDAADPVLKCLEERIRLLLAADGRRPYNYQLGVIADSSNNGIRWQVFGNDGPIGDWRDARA